MAQRAEHRSPAPPSPTRVTVSGSAGAVLVELSSAAAAERWCGLVVGLHPGAPMLLAVPEFAAAPPAALCGLLALVARPPSVAGDGRGGRCTG